MSINVENLIISNLLRSEDYLRAVMPHLKDEYFDTGYSTVLGIIRDFWDQYGALPTKEALQIEVDASKVTEDEYTTISSIMEEIDTADKPALQWLLDTTETFCKDKAIYNAVKDSIAIISGDDDKRDKGAIPDLLTDALAISFDVRLGHDYLEDAEARYEARVKKTAKVSFDIDWLNKATNGGVERKTLNVLLAGTNVGKSLGLVHLAAHYIQSGYNVLYITLEMAENKIADRVDANILDTALEDLENLPRASFIRAINSLKAKKPGRLMVKEYPTSGAHVGHFLYHVKELKTKQGFVPDVIIVDYVNICASSRVKLGGPGGSYSYVKSIAEELRGFFSQTNTIGWSATQVTRSGFNDSDIDLTDTSESWGLPQTADLMLALISTEETDKLGAFLAVLLKSRYSDKNKCKKFMIRVDRSKQKLYNMEQPQGYGLSSTPAAVSTPSTQNERESKRGKYEGIKV